VKTAGKIDRSRILRREPGREKSEYYEDDDQHNSNRRQRVVAGIDDDTAAKWDRNGSHG
jgi:hypothetical protein